ncbi:MAG: dihydrofolate synthase/folylpolyglutamate synthase [Paracoccaceae bacterium]
MKPATTAQKMIRNLQRTDAVLERLTALHPKLIDLGLDRTERLLRALGNPEQQLPPVIHVAGTNGKGSTIAIMRAIAEASGLSVHTYTSPHLIRFHERIVLNGTPIDEAALLAILEECETANDGQPVTFFEITTAAAFVAYARTPADLLLLETGLGGRFDSTNVIGAPAATVITPVSLDHMQFLGDTVEKIAFEKAGILKPGVPGIIGPQQAGALAVIEARAAEIDVPLSIFGIDWSAAPDGADDMIYRDDEGEVVLPAPALPGAHQIANAGAAIAALRNWNPRHFGFEDFAVGMSTTRWPGRLQRLENGPLTGLAPSGWEVWLDGGHNPAAGDALAETLAGWDRRPTVLVCAMQENKDATGFITPLAKVADRLIAIDLPGTTPGHPPDGIAETARAAGINAEIVDTLDAALKRLSGAPGRVLICGSLYLAGDVLDRNAA